MFGYLKIDKGELLVKEYETYKSIYCGLCKQLKKEYSFLANFILSYDCSFFVTLLLAIDIKTIDFKKNKCLYNPFKKCIFCSSNDDTFSKGAALNIILAYYKLVDDINDSGINKKTLLRLIKPIFKRWCKKAKNKYPHIHDCVYNMMETQRSLENNGSFILDEICHPTAKMFGDILKEEANEIQNGRILYQLGYGLGRFIYLIDAVDDFGEDSKKHLFNPFFKKEYKNIETMKNNLSQSLAMSYDAYNLLEINELKGIIDNVILKGLPKVQEEILKKVEGVI